MPAVSAEQFDATLRHSVFLERLKSGEVKKVRPFLQELDKELRERLSRHDLTAISRARTEALLGDVEQITDSIMGRFQRQLKLDLRTVAESEMRFEAKALTRAVANPDFEAVLPASSQMWAAVVATPLAVTGPGRGMLLQGFLDRYTEAQKEAITGAIRRGAWEGRTTQDIIKDIRGTKALGFKDGIIGRADRQAGTIVRTGLAHISSTARAQTFAANDDLVTGYRIIATLDRSTCEICQGLDQTKWNLEQGPTPPLHPNCRCTMVAELNESFSFLKEGATRASQGGPVKAEESYFSWLKKQPAKFQDAAIGPTRGKLLRNGGLSAERFRQLRLDRNFQPMTLKDMQTLEPLAFEKAGIKLNPATGMPLTAVVDVVTRAAVPAFTSAEPLAVGSSVKGVSNLALRSALQEIGTEEAGKLAEFVNNRKVGTVFGIGSKLESTSFSRHIQNIKAHEEWSKFRDSLGKAPNGSPGILQPLPGDLTKTSRGMTSSNHGYVQVKVPANFAGLASLDMKKVSETLGQIKERLSKPLWKRSSGRAPDTSERAWGFSYEARRLGASPATSVLLTWIHEMGHQVAYRSSRTPRPSDGVIRLTQYSSTNDGEWFAEHFVAWVLDRKGLMAIDPKAVEIIDKAVEEALKAVPAHLRDL